MTPVDHSGNLPQPQGQVSDPFLILHGQADATSYKAVTETKELRGASLTNLPPQQE